MRSCWLWPNARSSTFWSAHARPCSGLIPRPQRGRCGKCCPSSSAHSRAASDCAARSSPTDYAQRGGDFLGTGVANGLVGALLSAAHDDDAIANREDVGHAVSASLRRPAPSGDGSGSGPARPAEPRSRPSARPSSRAWHWRAASARSRPPGAGHPTSASRGRTDGSPSATLQRPRRHRLVIEKGERTKLAFELAAEEDIGGCAEVVGERKVLVDPRSRPPGHRSGGRTGPHCRRNGSRHGSAENSRQ